MTKYKFKAIIYNLLSQLTILLIKIITDLFWDFGSQTF